MSAGPPPKIYPSLGRLPSGLGWPHLHFLHLLNLRGHPHARLRQCNRRLLRAARIRDLDRGGRAPRYAFRHAPVHENGLRVGAPAGDHEGLLEDAVRRGARQRHASLRRHRSSHPGAPRGLRFAVVFVAWVARHAPRCCSPRRRRFHLTARPGGPPFSRRLGCGRRLNGGKGRRSRARYRR